MTTISTEAKRPVAPTTHNRRCRRSCRRRGIHRQRSSQHGGPAGGEAPDHQVGHHQGSIRGSAVQQQAIEAMVERQPHQQRGEDLGEFQQRGQGKTNRNAARSSTHLRPSTTPLRPCTGSDVIGPAAKGPARARQQKTGCSEGHGRQGWASPKANSTPGPATGPLHAHPGRSSRKPP